MTDIIILQGQLEALKTAWRSGAMSVNYDGKSVTYRDTAGMQAAIASLQNEIAAASGPSQPTLIVARSTKGY
jgi:hypothetical protein